mmetsp:Transcript_31610/g.48343  ORF Transcript_31610/g.48343 Transcript_31610/m.48343 type:complete len:122 (-) Transcript_31610:842-1207(-)
MNQLIKNSPGLIVDFWSPTCPPCMRIKPTYESAARANENSNLVFAAVNTQAAREVSAQHQISSIPTFMAFLDGKKITEFKGANEQKLMQTIGQLSEQVPADKSVKHDTLTFRQFKPSHLAP